MLLGRALVWQTRVYAFSTTWPSVVSCTQVVVKMSIGCSCIYFKQEEQRMKGDFPLADNRHIPHIHRCNVRTQSRHRVLHAVRIGDHAADALRSRQTDGDVVASFRSGVNARFTVDDRTTLIAFQTADVAFHPWAVEIQRDATLMPSDAPANVLDTPRSESVRPAPAAVVLNDPRGKIKVHLDTAAVPSLRIVPFHRGQAEHARRMTPSLEEQIHAALCEHLSHRKREILDERIDSIVAHFEEGSRSGFLLELIGLGSGATPSGDDILVGLLAALAAWRDQSHPAQMLLTHLRGTLPTIASRATSRFSSQMITAACDGAFSVPLLQLCTTLVSPEPSSIAEAIQRVSALGHDSGMRLLQGFLLGWTRFTAS